MAEVSGAKASAYIPKQAAAVTANMARFEQKLTSVFDKFRQRYTGSVDLKIDISTTETADGKTQLNVNVSSPQGNLLNLNEASKDILEYAKTNNIRSYSKTAQSTEPAK